MWRNISTVYVSAVITIKHRIYGKSERRGGVLGLPRQEMRNSDIHRCCWCRNSRNKLKAQPVIWKDDQDCKGCPKKTVYVLMNFTHIRNFFILYRHHKHGNNNNNNTR